jgi:hypothetical protein
MSLYNVWSNGFVELGMLALVVVRKQALCWTVVTRVYLLIGEAHAGL